MLLWFVVGLVALVVGAEWLVRGSSRLALAFGISPLVVGLTVVAFGTSAPELAVSVQSTWSGQVDIAMGNIIGSNIFNILCVLGSAALVAPLMVHQQVIRQEVPILIGASLLVWAMAADGHIERWQGLVLTALVVAYTVLLIRQSRLALAAEADSEADDPGAGEWWNHWTVQVLLVLAGLVLLVQGSRWLVESAAHFARVLGVSEAVIGLTIVAAGTSLPEVATSVLAALRGERDIAVGNAVGSSIFNIFAVLGISASVAPVALSVAPALLQFDLPVMVAVTIASLPIFFNGGVLSRWEGVLFLGLYVAYVTYLILVATGHPALADYRATMAMVLPLLGVTILVLAARYWHRRRDDGPG